MPSAPKPSKGRIVLYTFPVGILLSSEARSGQELTVPAVITNVFSDTCVNLRVFTDGFKRMPWIASVELKSDRNTDGHYWEWPTRD